MSDVRTEALTKQEKAEITALLKELRLMPQQGQVILHCNNGLVAKAEPVITLRGSGGNDREAAERRLQHYKDQARQHQVEGDNEKAGWYRKQAATLEKILAEEK